MNKYRCGDKHPTEDLYFWQMKRGKPYWVSSEELTRRRRYAAASQVARRRNPNSPAAEKHRRRNQRYREQNPEKVKEMNAKWRAENKEALLHTIRKRHNARVKTDPAYRLAKRMRSLTRSALWRGNVRKTSKTFAMLGCGIPHLRDHLQKQFQEGMSWDRPSEWHIDHIIPLASAKTPEEVVALCHYTNLQPLWAIDNIKKGAKIPVDLSPQEA